ncbi:Vacuolar proton pump subunit B (V-ATPase subunit B) (Vacuolar proton pump subunit B) [Psidium guajava]|nr:Vacuolar proton pump subunit B (V-ATPase subunit B) (Vacuolar proton pump subunit B) [Psidium guajava]
MEKRLSQKFQEFDEKFKYLVAHMIELGVESTSLSSLRQLGLGPAVLLLPTSCRSSGVEEECGSEQHKVTSGVEGAGAGIGGFVEGNWEEF